MKRMIIGFVTFLFSLYEVIGNVQMTKELLKGNLPKPDLNAIGVDITAWIVIMFIGICFGLWGYLSWNKNRRNKNN